VFKSIVPGAAAAALFAGAAQAAAPASPPLAWIITPGDGACRTELELTGRSGAVAPVTLTSDGEVVSIRFAKSELPERAFLPIRIDQKRFSNLMLRSASGEGELVLSQETEAAMRKGATLAVAWLSEEPVSGSLAGSGPGVADLRICGAQAHAQAQARQAAEANAKQRAAEDARARAVAEAQVKAARAQQAAADAERQRVAEVADRQRRDEAAERERVYAEERQRAYEAERARYIDEYQRRRDYEAARAREYDEPRWYPAGPQYYPAFPPAYGRRY
jgi:hypothetical protein